MHIPNWGPLLTKYNVIQVSENLRHHSKNYISKTTYSKAGPQIPYCGHVIWCKTNKLGFLHYLFMGFSLEKPVCICYNFARISNTSLKISNCEHHTWIKILPLLPRWDLTFIQWLYKTRKHMSLENKVIYILSTFQNKNSPTVL